MATFNWLNLTSDGDLNNHLNYLGTPAGTPGASDTLVIDKDAVGYNGPPTQDTAGTRTITTLTITNGDAQAFDFLGTVLTVTGNTSSTNTGEVDLLALGGNLSGAGTGDAFVIHNKTGNGTISWAGQVTISNLGTASVTIGATAGHIEFDGASAGSKIIATSTSAGGSPSVLLDSTTCEIDVDNVTLDLENSSIDGASHVTMVSTNGGHVSNYTQTVSGDSGDFIVTGGATTARHVADTITITLSGGRKGTFTPTLVKTASNEDELSGFSWNATTGVITGTVPAAWAGMTDAGLILNGDTGVEIDLPGFVTTAATVNRTTKSHIRSSVHI